MPFESFMRNEFIPIRNEFILVHVALTHAALGWEGQLALLLWLPRPGAAAGPRAAPRCPTLWPPSGRTRAWPTLSTERL